MQIKFRVVDGLIITWGGFRNLVAEDGEVVEESNSPVSVVGMIRTGPNEYRPKNQEELDLDNQEKEQREAEIDSIFEKLPITKQEFLKLSEVIVEKKGVK